MGKFGDIRASVRMVKINYEGIISKINYGPKTRPVVRRVTQQEFNCMSVVPQQLYINSTVHY
jgi:hypothetical protein